MSGLKKNIFFHRQYLKFHKTAESLHLVYVDSRLSHHVQQSLLSDNTQYTQGSAKSFLKPLPYRTVLKSQCQ